MVYMASPTELSLDCKPHSFSMIQNQNPLTDQKQKLQDFIARLEEERLKIEAFKRELPLCMQLLNNAMEVYRRQLEAYKTSQGCRPVLEEFIPFKNMSIGESTEKPSAEKASWMMSAQLWSSAVAAEAADNKPVKEAAENSFNPSSKQRSGGAFHPFSKEESCKDILSPPPPCSSATGVVMPELALASVDKEMEDKCSEIERGDQRRESCSKSSGGDRQQGKGCVSGDGALSTTAQRKARRCWSPDLHRRFVNALQILGGSQVATPKQIRELMKVDGLTNDEVKSHLQKYRLHTRRPMPVQAAAAAPQPHLLVLGGIWVPPEYATSAAAVAAASGPTVYASHPSPAHYAPRPPVQQEYYAVTPPPFMSSSVQLNGHLPPLLRSGGGAAAAHYIGRQASPESEVRSGERRSESIEEEEEEVVMMEEEKVALGVGKAEDGKAVHKF